MSCSVKKMEELLAYAEVPPAVNQVEVHPFWRNQKLIDFCKQHVRPGQTPKPWLMMLECALHDRVSCGATGSSSTSASTLTRSSPTSASST